MTTVQKTSKDQAIRDTSGRFKKGVSGNPTGRPAGVKNNATKLRESLEGKGQQIAQVVIDAAMNGDMTAAKLVIERILPPLRATDAPVNIEIPEGAGLAGSSWSILNAAASGELSPDVAAKLIQAVGALARVVEIDELQQRIEALEAVSDGKR